MIRVRMKVMTTMKMREGECEVIIMMRMKVMARESER